MNIEGHYEISIYSKIWFTSEGGIIGNRKGMTWDDTNYNKITMDQAEYIKDFLRQNSSGDYKEIE